jgi:quinohemoprotein ethanol dehydrogenase
VIRTLLWSFGVAAVALVSACDIAQDPNLSTSPATNWPLHGGHWGNTRYSTLDDITIANIAELGAVWKTELKGGISRNAPVVVDGLMFVPAGGAATYAGQSGMEAGGVGGITALNAATGEIVWQYTPQGVAGVSVLVKGAATGEGKVFVGLNDAHIVAVDQKTGEEVWKGRAGADPVPPGEFISAAPVYAKGLILVGIGSGDAGISGRTVALDAQTGEKIWEFRSVPGRGEPGNETWPQDTDAWEQGGGGVWASQAVDADLGLVYFGTGNAFPMQGGEVRPGDNLYTTSVVAVDLESGEYRWHFQMTRHDMWEADVGAPLVLYDAEVSGEVVPALAAMRMDGNIFLFNRATGEPLHAIEDLPRRQVTRLHSAATQPFPVGADQVGFPCVQQELVPKGFELGCFFDAVDFDDPNIMLPGSATRFAPMSYSPDTNHFYITGSVTAGWHRRARDPYYFSGGSTPVPGIRTYGLLVAFDATTRKITWQRETPRPISNGSGATTTAGGLLLHGEPSGNLQVYDVHNGVLLWQFQTGAAVAGPVSVYEADGKQFISVIAGQTVWGFALEGTMEPAASGPPQPDSVSGFAGRVVPADEIFMADEQNSTISLHARETFTDNYALIPVRARIHSGDTVTWVNNSNIARDVTAADGSWSSGVISPGKSATMTFNVPGIFTYTSEEHPWIYGQLIVEE